MICKYFVSLYRLSFHFFVSILCTKVFSYDEVQLMLFLFGLNCLMLFCFTFSVSVVIRRFILRWFLPLSGDCWACGETGGGTHPEETAQALVDAVARQGQTDFFIHAVTGSADIAFPNLDAQIRAMGAYPEAFGSRLKYDVMEGGVHDYETIFRYLYNALPGLFAD